MVNITIHRGTHQIGGSCTEIECDGERVLLDLGSNLPGTGDGAISDQELLANLFQEKPKGYYQGVFFTHYHGDHIGQYRNIPQDIPMFTGISTKKLIGIIEEYTMDRHAGEKASFASRMRTFRPGKTVFGFKKLRITPYAVDHSAMDAYCFLIEAEGKTILYTGDFRDHGVGSQKGQLWRTIDRYFPKKVDVLITEGTMLGRPNDPEAANAPGTEAELGKKAGEWFGEKKHNFLLVSSTNLDSIMECYHHTPVGYEFVCDAYQAGILMTAMEEKGRWYSQYRSGREGTGFYKKIRIVGRISPDLYRQLQVRGQQITEQGLPQVFFKRIGMEELAGRKYVMLVRPNRFFSVSGKSLFERIYDKACEENPGETQLIYSQWKGYLQGKARDEDICRFIGGRPFRYLHTGGHAYKETLGRLMDVLKPGMIIPMHTEVSDGFADFPEFAEHKEKVHVLNDGETYCLVG